MTHKPQHGRRPRCKSLTPANISALITALAALLTAVAALITALH